MVQYCTLYGPYPGQGAVHGYTNVANTVVLFCMTVPKIPRRSASGSYRLVIP